MLSPVPTSSLATTQTPIPATVTLDGFNRAPAEELVDRVAGLFAGRTLAAALVDVRPFATVDALCDAASTLFHEQDDAEILASVNAHPPIGGTVAAGSMSAAEQSAATHAGELQAIRDLQPVYRDRFGWNYLVRAAGRDSRQILDDLVERLGHGPDEEWPVVLDNLDAINRLRLRGFVSAAPEEVEE
jgi:2-oxo-4-hydroxy-4-carboxy-5-ureidoimidazoline decarboxylase